MQINDQCQVLVKGTWYQMHLYAAQMQPESKTATITAQVTNAFRPLLVTQIIIKVKMWCENKSLAKIITSKYVINSCSKQNNYTVLNSSSKRRKSSCFRR